MTVIAYADTLCLELPWHALQHIELNEFFHQYQLIITDKSMIQLPHVTIAGSVSGSCLLYTVMIIALIDDILIT